MPRCRKLGRKLKANEFYSVKLCKRVAVPSGDIKYLKKKNPRNHLTVYMASAKAVKGGEKLKLYKFVKKSVYDRNK